MQRIESKTAVSVSDLKRNFAKIMDDTKDDAIAILNHNRVMAYMVPSQTYEAILDRLEDLELASIVKSRENEIGIKVSLDDL